MLKPLSLHEFTFHPSLWALEGLERKVFSTIVVTNGLSVDKQGWMQNLHSNWFFWQNFLPELAVKCPILGWRAAGCLRVPLDQSPDGDATPRELWAGDKES